MSLTSGQISSSGRRYCHKPGMQILPESGPTGFNRWLFGLIPSDLVTKPFWTLVISGCWDVEGIVQQGLALVQSLDRGKETPWNSISLKEKWLIQAVVKVSARNQLHGINTWNQDLTWTGDCPAPWCAGLSMALLYGYATMHGLIMNVFLVQYLILNERSTSPRIAQVLDFVIWFLNTRSVDLIWIPDCPCKCSGFYVRLYILECVKKSL